MARNLTAVLLMCAGAAALVWGVSGSVRAATATAGALASVLSVLVVYDINEDS